MTAPRTVTVHTSDHGPVTIPEPMWCTGEHPAGDARVDVAHFGVDHHIKVPTVHGPRDLIVASLGQYPLTEFPDRTPGTALHVAVQLLDSDHYPYDVAGLDALAEGLSEAADKVRRLAHRLATEIKLGGGR